ncbi:radical SAM protein [Desulfonatronovibrio hydrogenovorans]|uniref:radical SAM protein n=1 Tax=Desulfonatronovibrio hydrogenovorans TaxID=53245 RepID=UPI00048AB76B|nr:radical SAM protein [Desulfonatronovibrio hydrogenovorans]
MSNRSTPYLVCADQNGQILEEPGLLMLTRQGRQLALPRPDDLIPLPESSDLFLLPGRRALGLDPQTGQVEMVEELAVAGFASPGHTLTGTAAFMSDPDAPVLSMYAYGAVGYMNNRFWISARLVDRDQRQVFTGIPQREITARAGELLKKFPENRLIKHLAGCALHSCCPAARNLVLGRFEAPLPTSRTCNAACIGCLSLQPPDSGFESTQQRISFTPSPKEIAQVMTLHSARAKRPILSFGQGCEGEPLTQARLISQAVAGVRSTISHATVNMNTNGSMPGFVPDLAQAGLDSVRVSLNSADPALYHAYYRPKGYNFEDVRNFVVQAKKMNLFVSLNLLYYPGVSDTETQIQSLISFIADTRPNFIQMRNLNLDPDIYLDLLGDSDLGPQAGLSNFMKRIRKECPWVGFGYFNPYLGDGQ